MMYFEKEVSAGADKVLVFLFGLHIYFGSSCPGRELTLVTDGGGNAHYVV